MRSWLRSEVRCVAICLFALCLSRPANADRAAALFVGPEVRVRGLGNASPVYELTVPHGIVSTNGGTAAVGRFGVVVPERETPVLLPISVGMRATPFKSLIRPTVGADIGGYLVLSDNDAKGPIGPQWCWDMRVLSGIELSINRWTTLLVYADLMWIQKPQDDKAATQLFSGAGIGTELRFSFKPALQVVDMLLQGTDAPEGF